MAGWKRFMTAFPGFLARVLIFFGCIFWIKTERPKIDYKKYLGSDWKPKYEGASTMVFNHTSWIDILVGMYWNMPSFLSQHYVRNYPGVGRIADLLQSLYLNRTGTKEEKEAAI
jgi:1-acyl-sn-glycerol-3-phosphate acyltransferase